MEKLTDAIASRATRVRVRVVEKMTTAAAPSVAPMTIVNPCRESASLAGNAMNASPGASSSRKVWRCGRSGRNVYHGTAHRRATHDTMNPAHAAGKGRDRGLTWTGSEEDGGDEGTERQESPKIAQDAAERITPARPYQASSTPYWLPTATCRKSATRTIWASDAGIAAPLPKIPPKTSAIAIAASTVIPVITVTMDQRCRPKTTASVCFPWAWSMTMELPATVEKLKSLSAK